MKATEHKADAAAVSAAAAGEPSAKRPAARRRASPTAKPSAAGAATGLEATAAPTERKPAADTRREALQPTAQARAPAAAKPKLKLVRDSFTMPQADFSLIQLLKERSLEAKRPAKKSELLRAGLHALAALDAGRLTAALDSLEPLKPGRPKKGA